MENRTGRHEPSVARVRTGRDSPGWGTDRDGSEWKTDQDSPGWERDQDGSEWETDQDGPEWGTDQEGSEWETNQDGPGWETGWDRQAAAGYERTTGRDSSGSKRGTGQDRRAAAVEQESRRQKGKRKRSGSRSAGARVRHAAVSVLLAAAVLVSVGAVGFLLLQISGKNSLYSRADSSALVSTLSGMAVELGDDIQDDGTEDWQEGDIRYKGVHYRYNADILTFLFLGIDSMEEVKHGEDGMDGGQSDALFLLVLDPHEKKISVIGIPRDTMTELEIYDSSGARLWNTQGQVALQHGYGDGAELSCERSVKAVSRLFYGLPVHGYCAVNMGAVPLINDAVGGIDLVAAETLDFGNFRVQEGEEIRLEGMDAYYYLHNRDTASFNSAGRRLQRQVQYLEAWAAAALGKVREDITFPLTLYGELSRYMVTDISVDEVGYLAPQAAGYGFSRENMHTLKGDTVMGEVYEEFYADEEALYELILEVFYEEV